LDQVLLFAFFNPHRAIQVGEVRLLARPQPPWSPWLCVPAIFSRMSKVKWLAA